MEEIGVPLGWAVSSTQIEAKHLDFENNAG